MKVQRIQIEQQMARIKIESQRAALRIQTSQRQMEVKREAAKMKVDSQLGKVDIDMTPLKNNTARKDPLTLQQSFASQSLVSAQQGTRSIASDGEFVGQQPGCGHCQISELSRMKLMNPQKPTSGHSLVPDNPVVLKGDAGHLNIDWTPQSFEIEWDQVQGPVVTLDPKPSVSVDLVQPANLQFSVVELTIPAEPGQTIDVQA